MPRTPLSALCALLLFSLAHGYNTGVKTILDQGIENVEVSHEPTWFWIRGPDCEIKLEVMHDKICEEPPPLLRSYRAGQKGFAHRLKVQVNDASQATIEVDHELTTITIKRGKGIRQACHGDASVYVWANCQDVTPPLNSSFK